MEHTERSYIFHLCADYKKIVDRLYRRSGRDNLKYDVIFGKDRTALAAYKKFIDIGIEGSSIRTDILDERQVMEHVLKKVGLADG